MKNTKRNSKLHFKKSTIVRLSGGASSKLICGLNPTSTDTSTTTSLITLTHIL